MKRKIILSGFFVSLLLSISFCLAKENIREQFSNYSAQIYTINIRNFGSVDKNFNGIIEPELGDIKGTFLNAKDRLNDIAKDGINTIYVLPITSVGKLKALGTAGSLYAMNSFNEIDSFLDDDTNELSVYEEAKQFIDEAHRLNLNVILDLPSCGAYDLSLNKPSWFILDKKHEAIIPADWTDVRLFKVYNQDRSLNEENLNNFKSFVDMAQKIGFDGIRADVAAIKPYAFWKKLIDYARIKNPDFLFLAEANPEWKNPATKGVVHYSSVQELLNAGFDSYYGSWSDFKNIKTKKEFDNKIMKNLKILSKNKNKSMISAFATHDQQAPILRGVNYWSMVLWLNATLPSNAYYLDGFSSADDFTYEYENKKALKTYTDDEYYFVHSGMFDIFNYSSKPQGNYPKLKRQYLKAIDFKERNADLIKDGEFKLLKTNNENVFAYSITNYDRELIVIGSLDEKNMQTVTIKSKYLKKDSLFSLINAKARPKMQDDNVTVQLEPLEIQVYLLGLAKYRAM